MIFGVLHNPTYMTSLVHTPNLKFREVFLGGMDKNMSSFFFLTCQILSFPMQDKIILKKTNNVFMSNLSHITAVCLLFSGRRQQFSFIYEDFFIF